MITIFHKTKKDSRLEAIEKFKAGSWIHVERPTESDIAYLVKEFELERGLLQDALDPFEVPRLEIDEGVVYTFTRMPLTDQGRVFTVPILIAIGKNFTLTLSRDASPFVEKFTSGSIEVYTTQKTKLFLQIFSQINRGYTTLITDISRKVRAIEFHLEKISNKEIVQFVTFESILNDFLSALSPTSTILQKLLSGKVLRLYEEDEDLTEDIFLNNGQLIETGKASLKNIVNIREAYSAIITNNLNRVIRLLTALTIVLTVPTIISSFYGMNVRLPLATSPLAFWIVLLFTLVISVGLIFLFIKNKWL